MLPPALEHLASHPLIEARGELAVFLKKASKTNSSTSVPRGTPL
jgi:hypothetical protein